MRITRKRIAILAALVVLGAGAAWAASPLFIETRADVAPPEGFSVLVSEGTWQGVDGFHFARGVARILGNGQGDFVLRLEDFSVRNGPDIHFFLSSDGSVGPGDLDLGSVPATTGSYHVPIPGGTDVQPFGFALVHCVPANFLFASAALE
jgi:hypothetical protein